METIVNSLKQELFQDGKNTYAILDGASVDGLLTKLDQWKPEFVCLYRGEMTPDLAEVAPYLVRLDRESPFTDWMLENGWGKHWGIFAISEADLGSIRQHFRRLLTVRDESGKPLLFRYYDPRVLRVFLPTCTEKELQEMFGTVSEYVLEGEERTGALRFKVGTAQAKKRELLPA